MINIKRYNTHTSPAKAEKAQMVQFLFTHLENFGDPSEQIEAAIDYALGTDRKPGGHIITAHDTVENQMVGAVVINETGMQGYIPENILVYIATHHHYRGQGIGKMLIKDAIETCKGGIALHCEPDNPARYLYEKLGFTSKYLEMRLTK